jgi:hypothetical protein
MIWVILKISSSPDFYSLFIDQPGADIKPLSSASSLTERDETSTG